MKSHVGIFGNDCVDGLAKLAYRTQADLLSCKRPEYGPYIFGAKMATDRLQYMREQLEAHGSDVATLQETRTKSSQLVQANSHIRVTSAAQDGKAGGWQRRSRDLDARFHPRAKNCPSLSR